MTTTVARTATPRFAAQRIDLSTERGELLAFNRRHFAPDGQQAAEASLEWRFATNPLAAATPDLWVCRRDGAIVGTQGGLHALLQVEGRPMPATWAIDLMVAPEWRLRGVVPALDAAFSTGKPLLCGLNISEPAHRAFLRAGWIDLGRVPRWIRLLRPWQAGQRLSNTLVASGRLAAATAVAAPLLAAFDRLALPLATAGTGCEAVAAFDERADFVWRQVGRHYPVVACRSLEHLRWRFDQAPQAASYRRHMLTRGGDPVGFAVMRRKGVGVVVVDYLAAPRDLPALIAHCLTWARREGASLLSCLVQPPELTRQMRKLGFVSRPGPRLMIRPSEPFPAVLQRSGAWHLTDGDSDLDHAPENG